MARRPIIEEAYKSMPKAPSGLSRPGQRDVRNYSPPKGPTNINDPKSPTLHGDGQSGTEYCGLQNETDYNPQTSQGPGLGGDSVRCCGSQGRH
jgi:hypothetical protein